jgi:very-short-patch-repair endonuclease
MGVMTLRDVAELLRRCGRHYRAIPVEVDGYAFHRTRGAFESDRRRDAELRAAGIDTTRVTWRQLTDEPLAVIARLAQSLAAASR